MPIIRRASKFATKTLVGALAASAIETTLTSHTDLDEDSTTVTVVSTVGGFVVSTKLEPHTDALVDKIADKLPKRKSRKQTPETAETTL